MIVGSLSFDVMMLFKIFRTYYPVILQNFENIIDFQVQIHPFNDLL